MNLLTELCRWQSNLSKLDPTNEIGAVRIFSCDNPGWWIKINLKNTPYEDCSFNEIRINIKENDHPASETDWVHCYIVDKEFNGAGDTSKLEKILEVFFLWIKENGYCDEYFKIYDEK